MQQLMMSEGCYDEYELGNRYFELRNVNADACRYPNPFEGKINSQMLEPIFPEPKIVEKIIKVPVEKIVEKIVEKEVKVPVEKIVEKEIEVTDPMDEEKLAALHEIKSELSALQNITQQIAAVQYVQYDAYLKLSSLNEKISNMKFQDVA